jgi:hypothetical protein
MYSITSNLILIWILPRLFQRLHIQAFSKLLLMLPIEVLEQHLLVLLLPLVLTDIIAPAAHGTGQAAWNTHLLADLGDGAEVGADGEDDAATAWQTAKRLPLRAEIVVRDGLVLLGCEPAYCSRRAVLGPDGAGPWQRGVDLDEVVVLWREWQI